MKRTFLLLFGFAIFVSVLPILRAAENTDTRVFIPVVAQLPPTASVAPTPVGCAVSSNNTYDLIPPDTTAYKNNHLTDENADLRLSVLGYLPVNTSLSYVAYGGNVESNAPRLRQMFDPPRLPMLVQNYKRYDWNWNENSAPPYGSRGGLNNDYPSAVIDVATSKGETIRVPYRGVPIWSNNDIALVLYASEHELTLAFSRSDSVTNGYVMHLLDFCVDVNLVSTYRAQISGGKRSPGVLPAVRARQSIGSADQNVLRLALRDGGAYTDPRSYRVIWE